MVELIGHSEKKFFAETIGLVATARWMEQKDLQPQIDWLNALGYQVKLPLNIRAKSGQLAGSAKDRAFAFNDMLHDPDVDVIWAIRGGYGSVQMVDEIDWDYWVRRKKPFIGYSDATIIHSEANKQGIQTIHAEMLVNFFKDGLLQKGIIPTLDMLKGDEWKYAFSSHPFNRTGTAEGILIGGNISVLASIGCSKSEPKYDGKILVLEDLDEYLYHLDRMMQYFRRSGKLANLAGLVIGGLTDMKDHAIPFGATAEEIIRDSVSAYKYPVAFGAPVGHIPNQMPVRFGSVARLVVPES